MSSMPLLIYFVATLIFSLAISLFFACASPALPILPIASTAKPKRAYGHTTFWLSFHANLAHHTSFESFHYDTPIISNNVIFEVDQDVTTAAALRIRYDAAVTVVLGKDTHVDQKMRGNERKRIFLYSVKRAKVEEYVHGTVAQSDGFIMTVGNPQVNMIGLYVFGGNLDRVVKMKFRGRFAGRNGILDREMCQYGSQLSIDAMVFNEMNVDVQAPVVVMKGVFLPAVSHPWSAGTIFVSLPRNSLVNQSLVYIKGAQNQNPNKESNSRLPLWKCKRLQTTLGPSEPTARPSPKVQPSAARCWM